MVHDLTALDPRCRFQVCTDDEGDEDDDDICHLRHFRISYFQLFAFVVLGFQVCTSYWDFIGGWSMKYEKLNLRSFLKH
ncbi:hypothetical protein HanRHA438_Chr17g0831531 [Helianthus annuus]|uniref:Uncharacterized protein n=1 Tax=Helianthus annuus TaxID=4232 RepID=A0A251RTG2_HELAN|nr:hypothetical protein HanXRQr2_Chr17g0821631 [Helianthus annuus]KAJ0814732.1 hypothetical protein HanPSC8_Chr17g0789251 [Helianthus annuus]KAJ0827936.1 hypothetical protein HanRHA438_Chr17g0831531 [Helianthus annuus]